MTMNDPYAEIAPFYDLEFDEFTADIELYLGYAGMVGGPVLELGCGSGRVLIPLAEAGFDVTGIDNSPGMIDLAAQRRHEHGIDERITLHTGDMRNLEMCQPDQFRLIFSAINSYLHLEHRDDHLQSLRSIRACLDRDGLLVLDLFHPTPDVLQRMDDRYTFDARWATEDGRTVQRFSHRHIDIAEQRIRTTLFYDIVASDGAVQRQTTSYTTRYIHRFEMESLLSECGFGLEGVYGSYALDPLDSDSEQMIFVAHRTANPGED